MGDEEALTIRYAEHAPIQRLTDLITYAAEGISLDFDRWDVPNVRGPGLYFVVVAGTSIDEFADPMGTNRWPTEECAAVADDFDAFFDTARQISIENDGAVVVTVDGRIHPQMVRLKDLSAAELADLDMQELEYTDWMGARHMSALDTSAREEAIIAITLSEENGRVTRFEDGTYTSWLREELGGEWRDQS